MFFGKDWLGDITVGVARQSDEGPASCMCRTGASSIAPYVRKRTVPDAVLRPFALLYLSGACDQKNAGEPAAGAGLRQLMNRLPQRSA
jgi:hypothetical protein